MTERQVGGEPDEIWFGGWQVLSRSPSGAGLAARGMGSPAVRDKGPSVRQLWAQVNHRRSLPARMVPLSLLTVYACSCAPDMRDAHSWRFSLLLSAVGCSMRWAAFCTDAVAEDYCSRLRSL